MTILCFPNFSPCKSASQYHYILIVMNMKINCRFKLYKYFHYFIHFLSIICMKGYQSINLLLRGGEGGHSLYKGMYRICCHEGGEGGGHFLYKGIDRTCCHEGVTSYIKVYIEPLVTRGIGGLLPISRYIYRTSCRLINCRLCTNHPLVTLVTIYIFLHFTTEK
jgi:hypothetical protein